MVLEITTHVEEDPLTSFLYPLPKPPHTTQKAPSKQGNCLALYQTKIG